MQSELVEGQDLVRFWRARRFEKDREQTQKRAEAVRVER
jgi:hypothetical protein